MLALSPPGTASAGEPTCFGKKATIVAKAGGESIEEPIRGTAGDDVIVSSDRGQWISGGDGDDRICGKGGNDIIDGGAGDDRMSGGRGADWINSEYGDDLILGGPGADFLNIIGEHENGDDEVFGGPGDDVLAAGVGEDKMFGESGDDQLFAAQEDSPLVDLFSGGRGTDTCDPGEEDKLRSCELRP
jgi:Ca2+-binding RTX toxin-like protein